MDNPAMIVFEIAFDVAYLVSIWFLALRMLGRRAAPLSRGMRAPVLLAWGFLLLALGDTGHVGFRVVAYASGGLDRRPLLVGLGALATEFTLTFLYALILESWRERNERRRGPAYWLVLAAAPARLVLLALWAVEWVGNVSTYESPLWATILLLVQGIGVALLILADAVRHRDGVFAWIGGMICASYLFFVPVVFFVQQLPALGFLMVPKTLAYLGMAVVTYRAFFRRVGDVSE